MVQIISTRRAWRRGWSEKWVSDISWWWQIKLGFNEWVGLKEQREVQTQYCAPYLYIQLFISHLPQLCKVKVKVKSLSSVRLFATPWTVAHQAPWSMRFSRHEYQSGLPFPSPGDLPDPGIKPRSPALQADALPSEPPGKPNLKEMQCQRMFKLLHNCTHLCRLVK